MAIQTIVIVVVIVLAVLFVLGRDRLREWARSTGEDSPVRVVTSGTGRSFGSRFAAPVTRLKATGHLD